MIISFITYFRSFDLNLSDLIPDADVLVAFEPDELGLRILPLLAKWPSGHAFQLSELLERVAGDRPSPFPMGNYPSSRRTEIREALSEAWAWLVGAALLVPDCNYSGGMLKLSRKSRRLAQEPDARRALSRRIIPKDILHPKIREDVWGHYHRGKYDTAVFEAMKAVEVAVRQVAGFTAADIGTKLMRKAFDFENGPLTDKTTEQAECQARNDLFSGAIGSYKNPHSHRNVALDDPDEAAEVIMLANHLLRIVDTRRLARRLAGGSP